MVDSVTFREVIADEVQHDKPGVTVYYIRLAIHPGSQNESNADATQQHIQN